MAGVDRHPFKDLILAFPVNVVRRGDGKCRHSRKAFCRRRMPDANQFVGVFEWQGSKQHTVHHAEDGGVRADFEGQRNQRDCSEAETLPQLPYGITKILEYSVHHCSISYTDSVSSLVSQRHHGIDFHGTTGWHKAGIEGCGQQNSRGGDKRQRIRCADPQQQVVDLEANTDRDEQPESGTRYDDPYTLPKYQLQHLRAIRAQGHADSDFPGSLAGSESYDAIYTNDSHGK